MDGQIRYRRTLACEIQGGFPHRSFRFSRWYSPKHIQTKEPGDVGSVQGIRPELRWAVLMRAAQWPHTDSSCPALRHWAHTTPSQEELQCCLVWLLESGTENVSDVPNIFFFLLLTYFVTFLNLESCNKAALLHYYPQTKHSMFYSTYALKAANHFKVTDSILQLAASSIFSLPKYKLIKEISHPWKSLELNQLVLYQYSCW